MGRFINADGFVSTGQSLLGNNMFAYCMNNPVNLIDGSGYMAYPCVIIDGASAENKEDDTANPSGATSLVFYRPRLKLDLVGTTGSYSELKALTAGTDYQVHHIVDYRFRDAQGLKPVFGDYYHALAVIVTKD